MGNIPKPTDDWPYLSLDAPTKPGFYLKVAGIAIAFTLLPLFGMRFHVRAEFVRRRVDWEMMAFGAAFLLLETAFMAELNLLFGATWRTRGVVFAAILFALVAALWRAGDG